VKRIARRPGLDRQSYLERRDFIAERIKDGLRLSRIRRLL